MPANSLDGIIKVSTCKVRSKLNYLLFAFLKFLVFAQFVTILPFFTLINKHISSYRNSMDATEVALMQVRGKKETEVCTTISKNHCLLISAYSKVQFSRATTYIMMLQLPFSFKTSMLLGQFRASSVPL